MTRNNSLKELEVAIAERGASQQPLQEGQIKIATNYITNVHNALREQIEPIYTTPEHPINGWGLLQTPFQRTGEYLGIPTIHVLGSRSIYLSTDPGEILRVLEVPDEHTVAFSVAAIDSTTVPDLLREDPSLVDPLIKNAQQYISEFNLRRS